jgi:hypothetical protein
MMAMVCGLTSLNGPTAPVPAPACTRRARRHRLSVGLAVGFAWLATVGSTSALAQDDESVAIQRRVSVAFAGQGESAVTRRVSVAFAQDGAVTVSRRASVSFATSGGQTVNRGLSVVFQNANEMAAANTGISVEFRTAAPSFTDDPLVARSTTIKLIHIVELRGRIDAMRARGGMVPYPWSDASPAARSMAVKAVHLNELRSALNSVYLAAGWPVPSYTTGAIAAGQTVVSAAQLAELRDAVARIW